MHYEVEQKFRVDDFARIESELAQCNSAWGPALEQIDRYYAHPARDFRVTDEAFRIRRTGTETVVTYKGPRIDATTKTRQETELPLPGGAAYFAQFDELVALLGFRRVADVYKRRRKALVDWEGERVEVSLDDVEGVGKYVELELIADEAGVTAARQRLARLAEYWGLGENERRSYLTLLLGESQP